MPINYSRELAGRSRSKAADRHLGLMLCFVAGATNAGGFLAVNQYTSHMTGIVPAMANHIALGEYSLALAGIALFIAEQKGILISWKVGTVAIWTYCVVVDG